ncbi:MAG: hypothetical protein ACFE0Q_02320 [Anaerolineae bacterium]
MEDERLVRASQLVDQGDIVSARQIVREIVEADKMHFDAWHALVQLAQTDQERRNAIYKMWGLRPDDSDANLLLDQLKAGTLAPLDGDNYTGLSSRKYKLNAPSETKDYTGSAIVTLIAYLFFWIVGFIFNLYYLFEASQYQQQHGQPAQGVGCLWAMLTIGFVVPVLTIVGIVLFVIRL